ncbi:MAG: PAS domain-containing sensor histidine kinase [Rhodobacteraceae bacterium]|nr:PAS domain-containing sensor histidine kinase [Paracoccaceae bacterium]
MVRSPADNVVKFPLNRLLALRYQHRLRNAVTLGLVILGPVLALATFLILGPLAEVAASPAVRLILLANMVYILVVATLVSRQVVRQVVARRARSAGSRLHLRLTGIFAVVALLPTVLVAVFATVTVNMGLEGWFSDRVSSALGNSFDAAEAYQQEHRDDLAVDATALAAFLNANRRTSPLMDDGTLGQFLRQGQSLVQRGLREVFVIDGGGEIRVRGEHSYLFDYEHPTRENLVRAASGEVVLIEDPESSELRALIRLEPFVDRYLYVSREVDGRIIALLDETQHTVQLYRQLEGERSRVLFNFGLIYLGFALILILAAIWLGLWFAERLSRPVGRLASAAQRIGRGDLDVRVAEERGDDEIAMLGRVFNRMTRQLKSQRDALVEQNTKTERNRRLFDSVLNSVTAGVVGLDARGLIDFMNQAAMRLLDLVEQHGHGLTLVQTVPEFAGLIEHLQKQGGKSVQQEINLTRRGKPGSLLVRITQRRNTEGALEGYVVVFDDITDLVSAQRMAAWGDVARRIAHEIKNPLTPIQLSAEHIRRKFGPKLGDNAEALSQYTNVIIRQTNDLQRIVDEFSKFARIPEPKYQQEDLVKLLTGVISLQRAGQPDVQFVTDIPAGPVTARIDAAMVGQALTNLMKNGGEAIESRIKGGVPEGFAPQLRVSLHTGPEDVMIEIADNGIGLPKDRAKLFEPYVTTRSKGTGLGLPIVKKIINDHGGTLDLLDAPPFDKDGHQGAAARIALPRLIL